MTAPVADPPLLDRLRGALIEAADPSRAAGMQAYMKSSMPYHGVSAVPLRQVCKQVFSDLDVSRFELWHVRAGELWSGARFREERYAAIELARDRSAGAKR
jgi:3-methyladenine DNA glycosylase AlkD